MFSFGFTLYILLFVINVYFDGEKQTFASVIHDVDCSCIEELTWPSTVQNASDK